MDQAKRLKLSAVAFTIFWVAAMLWWSEERYPANIVILVICGAVAGYLWYFGMRWAFQRPHLLPLNGDHGASSETSS
ncbi:hypothetical protein IVA95_00595 [Bradyrhizobium sp. 157]|jgi:hypothetical protein|uniref:hypothetical protein n=1 Tax=Bradyrhizobium sp. 157 TaxID=2782631 RepID=UPI001FFC23F6|nr:hypothetical protein [Bradyrhizobium sp. 157]MCK1636115.1 hypothetical protein [Bradyrhizobium sp. 157]